MDTIQLDPAQARSYDALRAFLEGCRAKALQRGHAQLVSIAAEASVLDPLAVLESIYEERQLHFYLEQRQSEFAIAGAEDAVRFRPGGDSRFAEVKGWIDRTLENTIAVGDPDLPFFGPCFFAGFTFFPEVEREVAFPSSTVFVPRWQVALSKGRCVAVANALVSEEENVEPIAKRIWKANAKFRRFDYSVCDERDKRRKLSIVQERECGGETVFGKSVARALDEIAKGEYQKIVLARALDLEADQNFHPLEILNTLRERYADCFAFSLANGKGQSFIGASPERLVSVKDGRLKVDVMAGTAPRGDSASEDATLAHALLNSDKDRREHAIVFESVCRRLKSMGIDVTGECRPTLKRLQNVQHLHVDLTAKLPDGIHLLDIVAALHPTPAVGGMPREAALANIRGMEAFERGLYAGPVGWLNAKGEGEFVVAIRSALVSGETARLFAGVGIVEGSSAERELQETNLKFRALKENLL